MILPNSGAAKKKTGGCSKLPIAPLIFLSDWVYVHAESPWAHRWMDVVNFVKHYVI